MCIAPNASINPINGEKSSASNVSITLWSGSTTLGSDIYITSDTPRIEPMRVCELDAGIPRYHVPKFQMMAAMRSASTAQMPNAIPECAILSSGRSFMMPIATHVPPITTPIKLKNAARSTAFFAEREFE